jgi:hypothetical protein
MDFLFHTILYFDNKPVYYDVHRKQNCYFIELLDNPENVKDIEEEFEIDIEDYREINRQKVILRNEIEAWIAEHAE